VQLYEDDEELVLAEEDDAGGASSPESDLWADSPVERHFRRFYANVYGDPFRQVQRAAETFGERWVQLQGGGRLTPPAAEALDLVAGRLRQGAPFSSAGPASAVRRLYGQEPTDWFQDRPDLAYYQRLFAQPGELRLTYFQLQQADLLRQLLRRADPTTVALQRLDVGTGGDRDPILTVESARRTASILAGNEVTYRALQSSSTASPSPLEVIGVYHPSSMHIKAGYGSQVAFISTQNLTPALTTNNTVETLLQFRFRVSSADAAARAEEFIARRLRALVDAVHWRQRRVQEQPSPQAHFARLADDARLLQLRPFVFVNQQIFYHYLDVLRRVESRPDAHAVLSMGELPLLLGGGGPLGEQLRRQVYSLAEAGRLTIITDKQRLQNLTAALQRSGALTEWETRFRQLVEQGRAIRTGSTGYFYHDKSLAVFDRGGRLLSLTVGSANFTVPGLVPLWATSAENRAAVLRALGFEPTLIERQRQLLQPYEALDPQSPLGRQASRALRALRRSNLPASLKQALLAPANLEAVLHLGREDWRPPRVQPDVIRQGVEELLEAMSPRVWAVYKTRAGLREDEDWNVESLPALRAERRAYESAVSAPSLQRLYGQLQQLSQELPGIIVEPRYFRNRLVGVQVQVEPGETGGPALRVPLSLTVDARGNVVVLDYDRVITGSVVANTTRLARTVRRIGQVTTLAPGRSLTLDAVETAVALVATLGRSLTHHVRYGLVERGLDYLLRNRAQGSTLVQELLAEAVQRADPRLQRERLYDLPSVLQAVATPHPQLLGSAYAHFRSQLPQHNVQRTLRRALTLLALGQVGEVSPAFLDWAQVRQRRRLLRPVFAALQAAPAWDAEALDAVSEAFLRILVADEHSQGGGLLGDLRQTLSQRLLQWEAARRQLRLDGRLLLKSLLAPYLTVNEASYPFAQLQMRRPVYGLRGGGRDVGELYVQYGLLDPLALRHSTPLGQPFIRLTSMVAQPIHVRLGGLLGVKASPYDDPYEGAVAVYDMALWDAVNNLGRITPSALLQRLQTWRPEADQVEELQQLLTLLQNPQEPLLFMPYVASKLEQIPQRLKNLLGARAALEIDPRVYENLRQALRQDQVPDLSTPESWIVSTLPLTLPQQQWQELQADLQRLRAQGLTDEAVRQTLLQERRRRALLDPVVGSGLAPTLKRVAVAAGVHSFSGDFALRNAGLRTAIGYVTTTRISFAAASAGSVLQLQRYLLSLFQAGRTWADERGLWRLGPDGSPQQVAEFTSRGTLQLLPQEVTSAGEGLYGLRELKLPTFGLRERQGLSVAVDVGRFEGQQGRYLLEVTWLHLLQETSGMRPGYGPIKGPYQFMEPKLFEVVAAQLRAQGQPGAESLYALYTPSLLKGFTYESGVYLYTDPTQRQRWEQMSGAQMAAALLAALYEPDETLAEYLESTGQARRAQMLRLHLRLFPPSQKPRSTAEAAAWILAPLAYRTGSGEQASLSTLRTRLSAILKQPQSEMASNLRGDVLRLFELARQQGASSLGILPDADPLVRGAAIVATALSLGSQYLHPQFDVVRSDEGRLHAVDLLDAARYKSDPSVRLTVAAAAAMLGVRLPYNLHQRPQEQVAQVLQEQLGLAQRLIERMPVYELYVPTTASTVLVPHGSQTQVNLELQYLMGMTTALFGAFRGQADSAAWQQVMELQRAYAILTASSRYTVGQEYTDFLLLYGDPEAGERAQRLANTLQGMEDWYHQQRQQTASPLPASLRPVGRYYDPVEALLGYLEQQQLRTTQLILPELLVQPEGRGFRLRVNPVLPEDRPGIRTGLLLGWDVLSQVATRFPAFDSPALSHQLQLYEVLADMQRSGLLGRLLQPPPEGVFLSDVEAEQYRRLETLMELTHTDVADLVTTLVQQRAAGNKLEVSGRSFVITSSLFLRSYEYLAGRAMAAVGGGRPVAALMRSLLRSARYRPAQTEPADHPVGPSLPVSWNEALNVLRRQADRLRLVAELVRVQPQVEEGRLPYARPEVDLRSFLPQVVFQPPQFLARLATATAANLFGEAADRVRWKVRQGRRLRGAATQLAARVAGLLQTTPAADLLAGLSPKPMPTATTTLTAPPIDDEDADDEEDLPPAQRQAAPVQVVQDDRSAQATPDLLGLRQLPLTRREAEALQAVLRRKLESGFELDEANREVELRAAFLDYVDRRLYGMPARRGRYRVRRGERTYPASPYEERLYRMRQGEVPGEIKLKWRGVLKEFPLYSESLRGALRLAGEYRRRLPQLEEHLRRTVNLRLPDLAEPVPLLGADLISSVAEALRPFAPDRLPDLESLLQPQRLWLLGSQALSPELADYSRRYLQEAEVALQERLQAVQQLLERGSLGDLSPEQNRLGVPLQGGLQNLLRLQKRLQRALQEVQAVSQAPTVEVGLNEDWARTLLAAQLGASFLPADSGLWQAAFQKAVTRGREQVGLLYGDPRASAQGPLSVEKLQSLLQLSSWSTAKRAVEVAARAYRLRHLSAPEREEALRQETAVELYEAMRAAAQRVGYALPDDLVPDSPDALADYLAGLVQAAAVEYVTYQRSALKDYYEWRYGFENYKTQQQQQRRGVTVRQLQAEYVGQNPKPVLYRNLRRFVEGYTGSASEVRFLQAVLAEDPHLRMSGAFSTGYFEVQMRPKSKAEPEAATSLRPQYVRQLLKLPEEERRKWLKAQLLSRLLHRVGLQKEQEDSARLLIREKDRPAFADRVSQDYLTRLELLQRSLRWGTEEEKKLSAALQSDYWVGPDSEGALLLGLKSLHTVRSLLDLEDKLQAELWRRLLASQEALAREGSWRAMAEARAVEAELLRALGGRLAGGRLQEGAMQLYSRLHGLLNMESLGYIHKTELGEFYERRSGRQLPYDEKVVTGELLRLLMQQEHEGLNAARRRLRPLLGEAAARVWTGRQFRTPRVEVGEGVSQELLYRVELTAEQRRQLGERLGFAQLLELLLGQLPQPGLRPGSDLPAPLTAGHLALLEAALLQDWTGMQLNVVDVPLLQRQERMGEAWRELEKGLIVPIRSGPPLSAPGLLAMMAPLSPEVYRERVQSSGSLLQLSLEHLEASLVLPGLSALYQHLGDTDGDMISALSAAYGSTALTLVEQLRQGQELGADQLEAYLRLSRHLQETYRYGHQTLDALRRITATYLGLSYEQVEQLEPGQVAALVEQLRGQYPGLEAGRDLLARYGQLSRRTQELFRRLQSLDESLTVEGLRGLDASARQELLGRVQLEEDSGLPNLSEVLEQGLQLVQVLGQGGRLSAVADYLSAPAGQEALAALIQQPAAQSTLASLMGRAAGALVPQSLLETLQGLIGAAATDLIGTGYNALIGLQSQALFGMAVHQILTAEPNAPQAVLQAQQLLLSRGVDLPDLAAQEEVRLGADRVLQRLERLSGLLAGLNQMFRDAIKPKSGRQGDFVNLMARVRQAVENSAATLGPTASPSDLERARARALSEQLASPELAVVVDDQTQLTAVRAVLTLTRYLRAETTEDVQRLIDEDPLLTAYRLQQEGALQKGQLEALLQLNQPERLVEAYLSQALQRSYFGFMRSRAEKAETEAGGLFDEGYVERGLELYRRLGVLTPEDIAWLRSFARERERLREPSPWHAEVMAQAMQVQGAMAAAFLSETSRGHLVTGEQVWGLSSALYDASQALAQQLQLEGGAAEAARYAYLRSLGVGRLLGLDEEGLERLYRTLAEEPVTQAVGRALLSGALSHHLAGQLVQAQREGRATEVGRLIERLNQLALGSMQLPSAPVQPQNLLAPLEQLSRQLQEYRQEERRLAQLQGQAHLSDSGGWYDVLSLLAGPLVIAGLSEASLPDERWATFALDVAQSLPYLAPDSMAQLQATRARLAQALRWQENLFYGLSQVTFREVTLRALNRGVVHVLDRVMPSALEGPHREGVLGVAAELLGTALAMGVSRAFSEAIVNEDWDWGQAVDFMVEAIRQTTLYVWRAAEQYALLILQGEVEVLDHEENWAFDYSPEVIDPAEMALTLGLVVLDAESGTPLSEAPDVYVEE
jgi:hypothetical protein